MSPFVHPALFWGGIGLISIPIIIHLITRRRFRRLDWAAMEFLLEAMRRTRRRIRLEQLLLLALRVGLIALIALAVSRPHLSREEFGWVSGPFQSEEKVFVLDDSLSMGHVEAGRSSLDRAVDALLAAVERVAADGGRDPVTILRSSRFEVPLATAVTVDADRLEGLRRALGGSALFPTALRMDLAPALEDLASSARGERGRTVHILTDLCAADWTGDDGAPDEALSRALMRLAESGEAGAGVRIVVVDVGALSGPGRGNLAITDFVLETPNPVAGIAAELRVEVANFGDDVVRGVGLRLRTETSLIPGPRIAEIGPGEHAEVRVSHRFSDTGLHWITAEIDGSVDGLPADDVRTLVVNVAAAVEVLIVDGEPSGVPEESESHYLAVALAPAGAERSGFTPAIAVESMLPNEEIEKYAVIVLANVPIFPEGFAAALGRWVRDGGGLVIFCGDQVDSTVYERALGVGTPDAPGADILPATIGPAEGDEVVPARIDADLTHPAFSLLAGGDEETLRVVDIVRFVSLEPRPEARVAARLTDPARSPLLVERQVGRGKVAIFAVPSDIEWTNWPRSPSYLTALNELAWSVARPLGSGWTHLAGTPVEVATDLARYQREARLRGPDHPATPEVRLLATPREEPGAAGPATVDAAEPKAADDEPETPPRTPVPAAAPSFRFTIGDTRRAGVYTLALKTLSGEEETRRFAINAHPAESDLRRIAPDRLAGLFEGVEMTVVRDPTAAIEGDRGRFEIADLLLGLFLAVLLVEGTLAWWFAHHRRGAGAGAPDDARPGAPAEAAIASAGGRP